MLLYFVIFNFAVTGAFTHDEIFDAQCYARRYADLLETYCEGLVSKCDTSALNKHFENYGRSKRIYGCEKDTDVRIMGCSRITLRDETHHIYAWLTYHRLLGISHFNLYFDSVTSDLSNPDQKSVYDELQRAEFVTVFNSTALDILKEWKNLRHCEHYAEDNGYHWLFDYDIDEYLTFGSISKNVCKLEENILVKYLRTVSLDASTIILPRIEFPHTSGYLVHPCNKIQPEVYRHRREWHNRKAIQAPKIATRTNVNYEVTRKSHHQMNRWTGQVVFPDHVVFPDEDHTIPKLNLYAYENEAAWILRINHYSTRSFAECQMKRIHHGMSFWRTKDEEDCHLKHESQAMDDMIQDRSTDCFHNRVRQEMEKLWKYVPSCQTPDKIQEICFVNRYPNLKEKFCPDGDVMLCDVNGLNEFFQDEGESQQLDFGCSHGK